MAVFQHDARSLHLVPCRAGGGSFVTEDLLVVSPRPGVPVILPTGEAVGRIHVPADAISGTRIDDVVGTSAPPDVGILFIRVGWIGYARYRGPHRIDAVAVRGVGSLGLLPHVVATQGVRDREATVTLRDFEFAIVALDEADVGPTDIALRCG